MKQFSCKVVHSAYILMSRNGCEHRWRAYEKLWSFWINCISWREKHVDCSWFLINGFWNGNVLHEKCLKYLQLCLPFIQWNAFDWITLNVWNEVIHVVRQNHLNEKYYDYTMNWDQIMEMNEKHSWVCVWRLLVKWKELVLGANVYFKLYCDVQMVLGITIHSKDIPYSDPAIRWALTYSANSICVKCYFDCEAL